MKKEYFFAILSTFLIFFISCKKEIKITENFNPFGTVFGGNNMLRLMEVIQTKDNCFVLCGTEEGGEFGGRDAFVMKVDEQFNIVWYKNFGGGGNDYINGMTIDKLGNILLVGQSYGFGIFTDTGSSNINYLFYNIYIDQTGKILWEKLFEAKPGNTNGYNFANTVLELKDNSYAVFGFSGNYSDLFYKCNMFGYKLSNIGELVWTRRMTVNANPESDFTSMCANAVISSDGNIITMVREESQTGFGTNTTFIKTSSFGNSFTTNGHIWKSKTYTDIIWNENSTANNPSYKKVPMVSAGGDSVIVADWTKKGFTLVSNNGNKLERKFLKNQLIIEDIRRFDSNLILSGNLFWAITDLKGNIIKEVYPKYTMDFLAVRATFVNKKNEVFVFGSLPLERNLKLVMLKFDQEGALITSNQ